MQASLLQQGFLELKVAYRALSASERAISFGAFRLSSAERLLLEGDKTVRLGSRALHILIALVERAGELVGKDELMARVWPNTIVEESNLKFQISALRRTPGRGQPVFGQCSRTRLLLRSAGHARRGAEACGTAGRCNKP